MFDVTHIAKLARLGLGEQEKEKIGRELTAILEFIEQLKKVDTKNVEPTAQVIGLNNVSRKDESQKSEPQITKQILANAPEAKDNFIKVKAVFE